MINITFFGTDIFAKIILEELIKKFNVSLIVTKPDEKVGRKQILQESKIAKLAREKHIKCLKPINLKDIKDELEKNNSDLFIIAEYGKIIPENILEIPKYGAINVHASLLPKYRGPSPIQYALLNNDKKTGVTIMQMDKEMDHGNIILQEELDIEEYDDQISLREKLANLGAKMLIKLLENNQLPFQSIEQNHQEATYTKLIEKNDGLINQDDKIQNIINKFRAYKPWPGIFIIYKNKRIKINDIDYKIYKLENTDKVINNFVIRDKELFLKDSENYLVKINKLQIEGKNEITSLDFINQLKNPAL
ncbi:MAG TPA: methionyl-tRNA formyltransferase [bacterium]|nr:methionyl-tRNA formyltransferase [Patescibacteria group bacterium]HPO11336.1 methionyl-tRNA formyltransferase [bacterium]